MSYRPHRFPTTYPVEIHFNGTVKKCFLTNITPTGAGLFEVVDVKRLDKVIIKCAIGRLEATVRWANDDQCGVQFKTQLGTRQMEQLRHAPTAAGHRQRAVHRFQEMR